MVVIEILAAVCGLVAVGLTIGRSVWCWPIGLVQVLLYSVVFYQSQLYSQTLLQVVFAILQIHGWWQWWQSLKHTAQDQNALAQVEVEHLPPKGLAFYVGLAVIISVLLGILMMQLTDAKWAMADAFLAGLSLVAQWLLIHRQIENWYLWIVVNLLSTVVFSAQQLWPTVILYIVFLAMAVHGLRQWERQFNLAANVSI